MTVWGYRDFICYQLECVAAQTGGHFCLGSFASERFRYLSAGEVAAVYRIDEAINIQMFSCPAQATSATMASLP